MESPPTRAKALVDGRTFTRVETRFPGLKSGACTIRTVDMRWGSDLPGDSWSDGTGTFQKLERTIKASLSL
jgi:hypothetical protein